MVKVCVYENCDSDSRKHPDIKFAGFVNPDKDLARASKWIKLVGRSDFEIETITKDTYICEKHFPVGSNLKYSKNPDLEPFPRDKTITYYARSDRLQRRSRESEASENPQRLETSENVKTYRKSTDSTETKHVSVACGVAITVSDQIDAPKYQDSENITVKSK